MENQVANGGAIGALSDNRPWLDALQRCEWNADPVFGMAVACCVAKRLWPRVTCVGAWRTPDVLVDWCLRLVAAQCVPRRCLYSTLCGVELDDDTLDAVQLVQETCRAARGALSAFLFKQPLPAGAPQSCEAVAESCVDEAAAWVQASLTPYVRRAERTGAKREHVSAFVSAVVRRVFDESEMTRVASAEAFYSAGNLLAVEHECDVFDERRAAGGAPVYKSVVLDIVPSAKTPGAAALDGARGIAYHAQRAWAEELRALARGATNDAAAPAGCACGNAARHAMAFASDEVDYALMHALGSRTCVARLAAGSGPLDLARLCVLSCSLAAGRAVATWCAEAQDAQRACVRGLLSAAWPSVSCAARGGRLVCGAYARAAARALFYTLFERRAAWGQHVGAPHADAGIAALPRILATAYPHAHQHATAEAELCAAFDACAGEPCSCHVHRLVAVALAGASVPRDAARRTADTVACAALAACLPAPPCKPGSARARVRLTDDGFAAVCYATATRSAPAALLRDFWASARLEVDGGALRAHARLSSARDALTGLRARAPLPVEKWPWRALGACEQAIAVRPARSLLHESVAGVPNGAFALPVPLASKSKRADDTPLRAALWRYAPLYNSPQWAEQLRLRAVAPDTFLALRLARAGHAKRRADA